MVSDTWKSQKEKKKRNVLSISQWKSSAQSYLDSDREENIYTIVNVKSLISRVLKICGREAI